MFTPKHDKLTFSILPSLTRLVLNFAQPRDEILPEGLEARLLSEELEDLAMADIDVRVLEGGGQAGAGVSRGDVRGPRMGER